MKRAFIFAVLLALPSGALAVRPVALAGVPTSPRIETKTLPGGAEGLPVWFLPRVGVEVLANSPEELRLRLRGRELRFTPASGWNTTVPLPAPEVHNGSVHVALPVLAALGVAFLADTPALLDLPLPPPAPSTGADGAPPPAATAPVTPAATLTTVRSSRSVRRATETQRVVLEFDGPVSYTLARDKRGLSVVVPDAGGAVSSEKLESGDLLSVTPGSGDLFVRLETGEDGRSEVFALQDPPRIVVDTVTQLDPSVTPPPDLDKLPPGVSVRVLGALTLVSFDPSQYTPKVVTAPVGQSDGLYGHVRAVGGVAGVNGGYFDPRSELPVDLVARGGLLLAGSLEKRAALGFTDAGVLFGFPRPRHVLSGAWGQLTVNAVTAKPRRDWVTLFVGDGRTAVGAPDLTTLVLGGLSETAVRRAAAGPLVPAVGEVAVTFDPAKFPQLPRAAGAEVRLVLNWREDGWDGVQEALAAGPLLVDRGRVVLDAAREGFDTSASIWRPTRQVAFALYENRPTIAYLEHGTPDDFARALVSAGVTRALRLDSGSSATVYVAGGYLNTVWSRAVPNAIVFVPRTPAANR